MVQCCFEKTCKQPGQDFVQHQEAVCKCFVLSQAYTLCARGVLRRSLTPLEGQVSCKTAHIQNQAT